MAWHSARDFIGVSLAFATYLLTAPALAQTSDGWEQCAGKRAATVDKQIEGCTLAIQSNGEAPERLVQALMARAIAFMTKGDFDRAIQDYDRALSLDPKNGLAFNNRGSAYGRIGDFDRAIGDYENSIRLKPDAALPFFNHGEIYAKRWDFDRAIEDYDKAIHSIQAFLRQS